MEITKQSTWFKIKKTLRYTRLYGPQRTYIKVRSEMHMRKRFAVLPLRRVNWLPSQRVGLIGCGRYGFSTITYYLLRRFGPVIGACMDIDANRAASLAQFFRIPHHTDNADELIGDDRLKMIYIASNHATHAEYAIRALDAGKHVYIEKPHVVSEDQLARLVEAMKRSGKQVFLGFNRPVSRLGRRAIEFLAREPGSGVYNWFVAGMLLDEDHWYHNEGEGGRVLGNLCHWTDYVLHLVPENAFPIAIHPTRDTKPDEDIAVAFRFNEGSIAVITYSAKGYPFEGVRERFSAQKGNCILSLDDFERLRADVLDRTHTVRNVYRHHGHRENICGAHESVAQDKPYDFASRYAHIANTAWLFLKTREALEQDRVLTIDVCPLLTGER